MVKVEPTRRGSGTAAGRPVAELALLALLTLLALGFGTGCRGSADDPKKPVETIDVSPGVEVDTSEDPQARARAPELVGVLPGDFPKDLPVYLPSSLVDFGTTAEGRRSVTLLTAHSLPRVRRELLARLEKSGWSSAAGAGESMLALRKGDRRAWLKLEDSRPGTTIRFEYAR